MATEKTTVRANTPVLYPRLTPYWCDSCMQLVTMISIEEATLISRMSPESLYGKIADHRLHGMQTSSGKHFICRRSLIAKA
jgi:hypothetical protein